MIIDYSLRVRLMPKDNSNNKKKIHASLVTIPVRKPLMKRVFVKSG